MFNTKKIKKLQEGVLELKEIITKVENKIVFSYDTKRTIVKDNGFEVELKNSLPTYDCWGIRLYVDETQKVYFENKPNFNLIDKISVETIYFDTTNKEITKPNIKI